MAAGNRPITARHLRTSWQIASTAVTCNRLLSAACYGVVLLALFTAGCTPQPESMWQDYRDRLQRLLQQPLVLQNEPARRALPATVTADHTTHLASNGDSATNSPLTLSLLEVEQSRACGLDQLAAERSGPLGKVMQPSVRLHYELRLLRLLPTCIDMPQLSPLLRQKLTSIYQHKTADIERTFQHFLAADSTLRSQLQGSVRGISQPVSITETEQALRQLIRLRQLIAQGQFGKAAELDIEAALSTLYRSQLLADLQHSLHISLVSVRQLNDQLWRLDNRQLCQADRQIRDNILQQIFISRLQPELASLDGITLRLEPLLTELYQHHPLDTEIQQRYQQRRQQLQQQLQRHVKFWQRWQQCGR